jgi:hypothetical protein
MRIPKQQLKRISCGIMMNENKSRGVQRGVAEHSLTRRREVEKSVGEIGRDNAGMSNKKVQEEKDSSKA